MARFIIRNYGLSRQFLYKGKSICLSNDQAIETDDVDEAAALGSHKDVHVIDCGVEFAAPTTPEKPAEKKERNVTVDDAEAVHAEKFPDEDEQQQETSETQPPASDSESTDDKDEIAYADMTYKEIQVLAKDRQIKTSGLKKAELILALEIYDETPDESEEPVE